ncbi:hypothetical protein CARG_00320 [Corynebacterium argentoratense DSM 44202]|uniref:Uncharacterized protein n=1 Tax=Corynebacterium argentoratense DSM 44202 TaxID=1348662 RepID=U3GWC2_9CORY|nr:hypothetical protein CARG_00320 [Corynebacterium argentoratense DSM 44202]
MFVADFVENFLCRSTCENGDFFKIFSLRLKHFRILIDRVGEGRRGRQEARQHMKGLDMTELIQDIAKVFTSLFAHSSGIATQFVADVTKFLTTFSK